MSLFHRRFGNDPCGNSDCRRARGHIIQHNAHCTDSSSTTYMYAPKNLGVSSKFHIILQDRHRTVVLAVADGHTLAERAVCAKSRIFVNEYVPKVIDPQTGSDAGGLWNTDAG